MTVLLIMMQVDCNKLVNYLKCVFFKEKEGRTHTKIMKEERRTHTKDMEEEERTCANIKEKVEDGREVEP